MSRPGEKGGKVGRGLLTGRDERGETVGTDELEIKRMTSVRYGLD